MKYKSPIWILSCRNPITIPSYVVSAIIPANLLDIPIIIFLENFDPVQTIKKYSPDVIIVSKMFHNDVVDLIKDAKTRSSF